MVQSVDAPEAIPPDTTYVNSLEELAYHAVVSKGQRLHEMTLADNNMTTSTANPPRVAAFLDHNSLQDWGYDRTIDPYEGKPPVYRGLDNYIPPLNAPTLHGMTPVEIQDIHYYPTVHHSTVYPSTGALFINMIDRGRGVLVAVSNHGPAHALAKWGRDDVPQPELRRWSDIAYLQWSDPSLAHLPNDLKYVVRSSIENRETIATIERVVANYCKVDKNWCLYPGSNITWDIEDEEAKALLGTPNGSGVAWLLAQHKRELGWKVVQSVTVFWDHPETLGARDDPSLLFWLGDVQCREDGNSATIESPSEILRGTTLQERTQLGRPKSI
jgi:hypothetical protein